MTLTILAKDFEGSKFTSGNDCPLARAAKRQTGSDATEHISEIRIGDVKYSHHPYHFSSFERDAIKACTLNFSDKVVREIELIEV